MHRFMTCVLLAGASMGWASVAGAGDDARATLGALGAQLGRETAAAYEQCPYTVLASDYFARFVLDPEVKPVDGEVPLGATWRIVLAPDSSVTAGLMADHLRDFLTRRMSAPVRIERMSPAELQEMSWPAIHLVETDEQAAATPGSFSLTVTPARVVVRGADASGLRDGVVRLVDEMGFRQAPILRLGERRFRPRLDVRFGSTPWHGSHREVAFLGCNAVGVSGGELYALSTSDAIPELADRRQPGALQALAAAVESADRYGFKTFTHVSTRSKFDKDDPIFARYPEMRGALTWKADGQYVLCPEHPLVMRYLTESVAGLFRAAPGLDGVSIIIGGEGFYHCYMRAYGVEKGHTNCPRCEKLGADAAVAGLCNALAEAARKVNPRAQVLVWPYSAVHVWSSDAPQTGFLKLLKPGTALLTEIEKDEVIDKGSGISKHLWDYSIDLIGPGQRAARQAALCKEQGIPVYFKSEPEISLEMPRLPHIPCLDRWFDRAAAMADCGAQGAWVFPAFRPLFGSTAAEVYKYAWWEGGWSKEEVLSMLADRTAGRQAGPHLRKAWRLASEAMGLSPEIASYYTGPYYLGPAHPMCADPKAVLPDVFKGYYLFLAESTDADGIQKHPTFVTAPYHREPAYETAYRRMEKLLAEAVAELDAADPLVPERCRLTFGDEASPLRWYYHTIRTTANFHESCRLRDRLAELMAGQERSGDALRQMREACDRWLAVLRDEQANAEAALPVMEKDARLNFRYGGDHMFENGSDMIRAKLALIASEIDGYLPSLASRIR